jgi:hypothetical protein
MSVHIVTAHGVITIEGTYKIAAGAQSGTWVLFPPGDQSSTKAIIHAGPETVIVMGGDEPPPTFRPHSRERGDQRDRAPG